MRVGRGRARGECCCMPQVHASRVPHCSPPACPSHQHTHPPTLLPALLPSYPPVGDFPRYSISRVESPVTDSTPQSQSPGAHVNRGGVQAGSRGTAPALTPHSPHRVPDHVAVDVPLTQSLLGRAPAEVCPTRPRSSAFAKAGSFVDDVGDVFDEAAETQLLEVADAEDKVWAPWGWWGV